MKMVARKPFDVFGYLAELFVGNLRWRKYRHHPEGRSDLPDHLGTSVAGQSRRYGAAFTGQTVAGGASGGSK
jgi:hypothetical protein